MTITILRTDGREEAIECHSNDAWATIHRLLDTASLDTVNLRDGRIMVVDDFGYEVREEERVIDGVTHVSLVPVHPRKPYNDRATALYHAVCKPGTTHRIVGDVAVVWDRDFES